MLRKGTISYLEHINFYEIFFLSGSDPEPDPFYFTRPNKDPDPHKGNADQHH